MRIEAHERVPIYRAIGGAKILNEGRSEFILHAAIFIQKRVILFLGTVTQRLDQIEIQRGLPGDQGPEFFTTQLEVLAFVGLILGAIAAAIDCNDIGFSGVGSKNLFSFAEIQFHLVDLTGIAPIRAGLDRYQIFATIALEFKIDAFGTGFFAAERLRTDENRSLFEKLSK